MKTLIALAALVVAASGCTLLLPTQDLIVPCTSQDECEDGFICEDNACLPEDEDTGAESN